MFTRTGPLASQWADTTTIARGVGRSRAQAPRARVYASSSIATEGAAWETNRAGKAIPLSAPPGRDLAGRRLLVAEDRVRPVGGFETRDFRLAEAQADGRVRVLEMLEAGGPHDGGCHPGPREEPGQGHLRG